MTIVELFKENFLGQTSGIIAMLITIIAISDNDDKKVIKKLLLANIIWAFHGILMGAILITLSSIVGIFRSYFSLKYGKNKLIVITLISASTIIGAFAYENIFSLLPIIAMCISIYSFFNYSQIKLRIFMLISSTLYLSYYIYIGSIGGIVNEAIVELLLILVIYKIYFGNYSWITKKLFFYKNRPDIGRFIGLYDLISIKNILNGKKIINFLLKKIIFRK